MENIMLKYYWFAIKPSKYGWTYYDSLDDIIKKSHVTLHTEKNKQPSLSVTPQRSVWNPSSVFFIDIDSKEGVDTVIDGRDKLFDKCKWIRAIQKSASGKLHIICVGNKTYQTEEEWNNGYILYLAWTLYCIERLFNIDYYSIHGAIDLHSCKYSQMLYVSGYPIYQAKEQYDTTGQIPDKNGVEYLMNKYPKLFDIKPNYNIDNQTNKVLNQNFANRIQITNNNINRICVDRNCNICGYSGNDLRVKLMTIVNNIFDNDDDAKSWCDKYFYYENNRSIWAGKYSYNIDNKVLNWLSDNGYILLAKPKDNFKYDIILNKDQYLSDIYNDEIKPVIDVNNVCEIISPCGTGKTILISKYIAKDYNAVVICPYNATNNLYINEGMKVVNSDLTSEHKLEIIKSGEPCVMIYDQYILYKDFLKERTLIIDEAHLLFFDESYRDSITKFKSSIKENKNRLIMLTATESYEAEEFKTKLFYVDKIGRPEHNISISLCADLERPDFKPSVFNEEANLLKRNNYGIYNNYDHIVFFDDRNAHILAEQLSILYGNDNVCVLRSETRSKPDFKEVVKSEILSKKLIVCTRAAFQGLNFKNTDKIYVVFHYEINNTAKQDIIQCLGRFRNVKVDAKIILSMPVIKDIEKQFEASKDVNNLLKSNNISEICIQETDEKRQEVILNIQQYKEEHSNFDELYNYITRISSHIFPENFCVKSQRHLQSEEEKIMLNNFINNLRYMTIDQLLEQKYETCFELNLLFKTTELITVTDLKPKDIYDIWNKQGFSKKYENMCDGIIQEYKFMKLNKLDRIKEIYTNLGRIIKKMKNDKAIDEIKKIKMSMLNDRYRMVRNGMKLKIVCDEKSDEEIKKHVKEFYSCDKKSKQIEGGRNGDKTRKCEAGRKGGKNGSPKKRVVYLETGKIYNSVSEMCEYLGHNISWASKNKDKWTKINNDDMKTDEKRFNEYEELFC